MHGSSDHTLLTDFVVLDQQLLDVFVGVRLLLLETAPSDRPIFSAFPVRVQSRFLAGTLALLPLGNAGLQHVGHLLTLLVLGVNSKRAVGLLLQ